MTVPRKEGLDAFGALPRAGSRFAIADLLTAYAFIQSELRARGLTRSTNVIGDYCELLVKTAFGGALAPKSQRDHDVICERFGRVQVKSRGVSSPPTNGQFESGVLHDRGFDTAVFVLLATDDYRVVSAAAVTRDALRGLWRPKSTGYVSHVNAKFLKHPDVLDVTSEVQDAATILAQR